MKEHPSFYENLQEARMRLAETIVLYDGLPYYVLTITDHKPDGIFRIYLESFEEPEKMAINSNDPPPYFGGGHPETGNEIDSYMKRKSSSCTVLRKMMNSPAFNRFRPFPLGMCNYNGDVIYIERQPTRHTQQGLTHTMLNQTHVSLDNSPNKSIRGGPKVDFLSSNLYDTIVGRYPSAEECVVAMKDPMIGGANRAVAFDRSFAFVRGPFDFLFLAYKEDIVGYLPDGSLSSLVVDSKYQHLREIIDSLNLFKDITIK